MPSASVDLHMLGAPGKLIVILWGIVGLALVGLGMPRTIAAWYSFATEPALQKLQMQSNPLAEELTTGVAALQQATLWDRSARRLGDLSLLELAQALVLPRTDPQRHGLLVRSEHYLIESLIANPADGFGWLRLAMVRELLGAPRRHVAVALAKSLDMAPNVRSLWIPRATMFFVYWFDLTSDELLAMKSHFQMIWSQDEDIRLPLLQAADRAGGRALIAWALIGNDQALRELDALNAKLPTSGLGK
jgi:hypothetical protein